MNLPPQLQQKVEKWSNLQGIDPEQFIMEAISEKVNRLDRQQPELPPSEPTLYRKSGVLVVDVKWDEEVDINEFIDRLREERIQEIWAGESSI
jgi:hypothetical protein